MTVLKMNLAEAAGIIALFKGVKYSGVRSTPLYFTLPYFTQLQNAIDHVRVSMTTDSNFQTESTAIWGITILYLLSFLS
jgi:hypothetical protein